MAKRLNPAGWFWLSYSAVILAGLLYSVHSHAGYFARVTAFVPAMNYTSFALGAESGCYLTPSMAVSALSGTSYYWRLTSIETNGMWSAIGDTGGGGTVSGTFGTCTAQPSVTFFPPMSGGVVDPAISGDSVLSGSGGSSGGSGVNLIMSAAEAEPIAGAFLLLLAIAFGVRMIRRSMDIDSHVSDEKH